MEKKNISVLMIIGLFYPVVGGAEKVCQQLSKSFIDRGMSVTVLTQFADGLPEHETIDGIPVYRKMRGWHPFGLTYMISVLYFLVKYRKRFDIIQCFGLFLFVPPAVVMKYVFKKSVVVRILCSGQFGDFAGITQLKLKRLVTSCAKRCDSIVHMSNDIKEELLVNRFPAHKLLCIPNGVDSDRFALLTTAHGKNTESICFVGRIESQKGLDYLLRALAIIIAYGSKVKLFIVGDGKQRTSLQDLAKNLALGDHVVFTGFQHDVLSYYRSTRAFVLPSLSEGMSSALLEAMSCGLPVITTRVGAGEEIVGADLGGNVLPWGHYHIGKRGIMVNPRDEKGLAKSIYKLLQDDSLSKNLGVSAREFVRSSYSYEGAVNAYQDLYNRLL